jgi:glutamine phosphoribosylpyrophosphate amidotransferase
MSGIFGVVAKGDCVEALFYGTDYHSHLGTEYGGLVVLGEKFTRHIRDVSQSQFKSKFCDDYRHMRGNKGIGVVSASDEQPIYLNSKFGPFSIATNGIVENAEELTAKLLAQGVSFSEVGTDGVNTTELVAKLISQGNNLIDGIFSTRSTSKLAARKAIRALEGHDIKDVSSYIDCTSEKYEKMVEWIARDLGVSTLRYQTVADMVEAIGCPKEKLCLYCWTGKCPKSTHRKLAIDIVGTKKTSQRKATAKTTSAKPPSS